MAAKRKKRYNFHSEWEEEFFFTTVKETCVCLICGVTVVTAKQQSFYTRPAKNSQKATKASFRAAHFLIKKKKAFSDGEVFKEAMMIIAW